MIYALIGPPGVGKTTLAETMVRYMNAVVVSRDKLREMLFGYKPSNINSYWDREDINNLEKTINNFQDKIIKEAISKNKDVIVDNTHLKLKYLNDLKKYNVPIKFILVETDLATALERNALRDRVVPEDFIRKSFEELEHLKKNFDFKDWQPEEVAFLGNHNPSLGYCYIFDIDGTLALNNEGRSPYDYSRVNEDSVNEDVVDILRYLDDDGYPIILCSGRPEKSRQDTEEWLIRNFIPFDGLYMRKDGDNRKDFIVKEEMWRDILKQYNVRGMFDDRNQVVDHARRLGFTVFQVADGNF